MNISATILLAFGMSMDAFAASIGKGATLHKPKFSEALRTGLIFGAIETLTPLVGWGWACWPASLYWNGTTGSLSCCWCFSAGVW